MIEIIRCERCNRVLKNPESIKRGYGLKCFKIVQMQKQSEIKPEVNAEIDFLKMEIKTLKKMIRNIQVRGITVDPIERIKRQVEAIPNVIREGFGNVVKEMKSIFTENFNYRDVLKPAVREFIEAPPMYS